MLYFRLLVVLTLLDCNGIDLRWFWRQRYPWRRHRRQGQQATRVGSSLVRELIKDERIPTKDEWIQVNIETIEGRFINILFLNHL